MGNVLFTSELSGFHYNRTNIFGKIWWLKYQFFVEIFDGLPLSNVSPGLNFLSRSIFEWYVILFFPCHVILFSDQALQITLIKWQKWSHKSSLFVSYFIVTMVLALIFFVGWLGWEKYDYYGSIKINSKFVWNFILFRI